MRQIIIAEVDTMIARSHEAGYVADGDELHPEEKIN